MEGIHLGAQNEIFEPPLILLTTGPPHLLLVLPSKYIWNPITSHHLQATTLAEHTAVWPRLEGDDLKPS